MNRTAAFLFHAPLGRSDAERFVEAGRRAAARDLIAKLHRGGIDRVLIVTSSEEASRAFADCDADPMTLPKTAAFNFGETLKSLIQEVDVDGLLYFGSGSGGLLTPHQIRRLASFASQKRVGAVLNNFYSCDFAAIAGAKHLLGLSLPAIDNPLGFALSDAGIPCSSLPRSAATQFDVDTPTDLHLLRRADRGGPETRSFLKDVCPSHPSLEEILELLTDRSAHVCLFGRVNPGTWAYFEHEVACRTSGLIEGRGMRSSAGKAVPYLRQTLREDGVSKFFQRVSRSADGALIDTRPLLAGRGGLPPPSVRFASDLFRTEEIEDPLWKSFTEEARIAPIPVVLGGHSLVSGGLYLIAEACWKGRDLPRRLHPEPFDWEKEKQ